MRTDTPGWAARKRPTTSARGSTAKGGQGHQVDVPGPDPGHLLGRGPGGRRGPQHLAGRADEGLARRREADPSAQAVEQHHPQVPLEGGDGLGQRRLGDPHLVGGGGEAAGVDHRQHVLDLAHLHTDNVSDASAQLL